MKYISFTKNETKVIIFIIIVLVAGFSIKYYKQVISGNANVPYDFSKEDSEFKKRSLSSGHYKSSVSDPYTDTLEKNGQEQEDYLQASDDSLSNKDNSGKVKAKQKDPGKIININTAQKNELMDLPGIGESTADKILNYRNMKKGFRKKEDLMNISGIGKKKFEKLKNYIKAD